MITALTLAAAMCVTPTVHDGDSIRCGTERIRLLNIDAPELRGSSRCSPSSQRRLARSRNPAWCDPAKAIAARDALRAFLAGGRVIIQRQGKDTYGRTLARVTVNGRDAGQHLITLGLARKWR
ncbi:MAG: thermonuclease family protein [Novosphingobium sp.]|uniref:thermonuclease family protein n=1 Tax=Novosphingobium sp. TaxID=1874826 RepID=UPI002732484E|nr:thermonuclease family protein [Novosphingobium sp.]MDP3550644.1 thermonuclease family protein [Novosphingobium sp.]